MTAKSSPFTELIATATASAVHLEMRDTYTPRDPDYLAWLSGVPLDTLLRSAQHQQWATLVRTRTASGITFRRARIVSEPLTDFIRFEYELTGPLNIAAGEQVRWLPRRRASDLRLPGNDFWILDCKIVRFGYFAGDGEFLNEEITDDPEIASFCTASFEAVWKRATDHHLYQPAL